MHGSWDVRGGSESRGVLGHFDLVTKNSLDPVGKGDRPVVFRLNFGLQETGF